MCYDFMVIMIILISLNILECRFVAQNSSPTNRGVSQPLLALDVGPRDARNYQLDKQSTTFGTSLDSSSWYCLTGDKPCFMWKKMRNTRVFCGHSPNYTNPRRMGTVSLAITLNAQSPLQFGKLSLPSACCAYPLLVPVLTSGFCNEKSVKTMKNFEAKTRFIMHLCMSRDTRISLYLYPEIPVTEDCLQVSPLGPFQIKTTGSLL